MLARRLLVAGSGGSFTPLPWISLDTLLGYIAGGFTKDAGNPIFAKGAGGQWDDFGIREFGPVIDEDGLVVTEADGIWAYYGGRGDSAGVMDIGLAKSTDNGTTWTRYGSNPVVTQAGAGWYQTGIAQPSVVKLDDGSRVMAAQGLNGATYSVGVLTSSDGLTWADAGQKLVAADFGHGADNITLMGVPAILKRESGTWVMLLECLNDEATPAWHIFGATAADPTGAWTVMNSGEPVFTHTGAGWEAQGVANPHFIECTPGVFLMAYNALATAASEWEIGFAYTSDFSSWTRIGTNPVVVPGAGGQWDEDHTETSALLKEPVYGSLRLFYQGGSPVTGAQQIGLADA